MSKIGLTFDGKLRYAVDVDLKHQNVLFSNLDPPGVIAGLKKDQAIALANELLDHANELDNN